MNVAVIILLIALVAIAFKFRTSTVNPAGVHSPKAVKKIKTSTKYPDLKSPYRAVSINPAGPSCAAALELEGERFLIGETPQTPVQGCTSSNCRCKYIHHADRRSDQERRDPLDLGWGRYESRGEPERRTKWWRRGTDGPTVPEGYDWINNLDWGSGVEDAGGTANLHPKI